MSSQVTGILYTAGSAASRTATLELNNDTIAVTAESAQCAFHGMQNTRFSDGIPGVATEVRLPNGDLFIADDVNWRVNSQTGLTLSFLETNKLAILSSLLLAPILVYWLIAVVMPAIASKSVDYLPDSVATHMGEQTFIILEKSFLDPSELAEDQIQHINQLFERALDELQLTHHEYQLFIKKSTYFSANALALPNGTIIVTDDLVTQLNEFDESQFDAMLTAIILHEIGHVEAKHSVRMVAQSLSNAIVFSLLFGDLETIGELIIGSSSALLQSRFSRDMESEADDYALQQIERLGYQPNAFAEAMSSFETSEENLLSTYFSSHPGTKERIEKAKQFE
jgi:Zn-dependent protease with chaperone function